jgi:hypothetical protein
MRRIRPRLDRLTASAAGTRERRTILQRVDGTAEPSDEDVAAECARLEAAGFEPTIIRVEYVNRPPTPTTGAAA